MLVSSTSSDTNNPYRNKSFVLCGIRYLEANTLLYEVRSCQLSTRVEGVQSQSSWIVTRLFGKQHWCASYVDALCNADPNFLIHLSEQTSAYIHYICLVRMGWKYDPEAPSIVDQARLLQHRSQKTILRSLYRPYPTGLLNTLSKLGSKPLNKSDYQRLIQLLRNNHTCPYLAHAQHIKPYHLKWLEDFPCDLLHWRILHSVKKAHHYASVKYIGIAVRRLKQGGNNKDILISLKRIKSLKQLENWFRRHVQTLPFPDPPWPGNDWIKPITSVRELKAVSLTFKNCIYDYTRAVLLGHYYFYHVDRGPAIVELVRDPVIGWRIEEINGMKNVEPDPSVISAIEKAFSEADFSAVDVEDLDRLWDANSSFW